MVFITHWLHFLLHSSSPPLRGRTNLLWLWPNNKCHYMCQWGEWTLKFVHTCGLWGWRSNVIPNKPWSLNIHQIFYTSAFSYKRQSTPMVINHLFSPQGQWEHCMWSHPTPSSLVWPFSKRQKTTHSMWFDVIINLWVKVLLLMEAMFMFCFPKLQHRSFTLRN